MGGSHRNTRGMASGAADPVHPSTAIQPAELRFRLDLFSWTTFLWATVLSILPMDIVLVALGHGVAETRTVLYWTIAALILLTSLTIWLRHRLARVLKIPTKLADAPSPSRNEPTTAAPD